MFSGKKSNSIYHSKKEIIKKDNIKKNINYISNNKSKIKKEIDFIEVSFNDIKVEFDKTYMIESSSEWNTIRIFLPKIEEGHEITFINTDLSNTSSIDIISYKGNTIENTKHLNISTYRSVVLISYLNKNMWIVKSIN